jgi:phosphocarrier protein
MVAEMPEHLDVQVIKDGVSAAGGSILGLMMLGAAKGDTIEISVSGDGAEAALASLTTLVRDRFGEE